VTSAGTPRTQLARSMVAAPADGVAISVFAVHSLRVSGNVSIIGGGTTSAVAVISHGPIVIDGQIVLDAEHGTAPGAFATGAACIGHDGIQSPGQLGAMLSLGGGGGGYATSGGDGGGLANASANQPGGASFADPTLVPLRGGCAGGKALALSASGHGGGAIQLSSSDSIELTSNGRILANGYLGALTIPPSVTVYSVAGGGSGGAILLEAPNVVLRGSSVLAANGSGGQAGDGAAPTNPKDGTASKGGTCQPANAGICTNGGDGGTATMPSQAANLSDNGFSSSAGGGGGAAGVIRINVLSGAAATDPAAVISPSATQGRIVTR